MTAPRAAFRLLSAACGALALSLMLAGCGTAPGSPGNRTDDDTDDFPAADRPVAAIVSSRWSTEETRDRLREADTVMDKAEITPGMTVADIGAGEGYYTTRLADRVGARGRVLAEDIIPSIHSALAERVTRERLSNVSVRLGEASDPKLPENSFDRIFMVHMYHEIEQPYAFLWRMRPSLKPDGLVVVVDANRPTEQHGTPPDLLRCEFAAVGYSLVEIEPMPRAGGYFATFRVAGPRPEPRDIVPCRLRKRAAKN
ncbi:class I SAM-dependent methyltransferase [Sphingomonas sp. FW199]|uniref:class I SAM-dependent methyltransferase n=1 Tax=Sphingomonas sp. FW199 TaxID=3400217 RepID=UPI003CE7B2D9